MNKRAQLTILRKVITEALEDEAGGADELNSIEVGDIVDVEVDEIGTLSVRVIELVDDVNDAAGDADPRNPNNFTGPGFIGEIDPESGESGSLVFSLNQVLPGSKAKGYFPKLGGQWDEDEYGRDVPNPYRKLAKRFATASIEPDGSYVSGLNKESLTNMSNEELRKAAAAIWQRYRNGGRPTPEERDVFTQAYWAGVLPRDPNYGDLGQWVEDGYPSM